MADDLTTGYARGIVAVAQAEGALERVTSELLRFGRAIAENPQLREALADPSVDPGAKLRVAEDLLPRAHPQTVAAVAYVVSSGRARLLEDITRQVGVVSAEQRGGALAEVRTAMPLNDEQRRRLQTAVGRVVGQDVELHEVVDPALVGGVRVQVGDTVIDGSIARRIDDMKAALTS